MYRISFQSFLDWSIVSEKFGKGLKILETMTLVWLGRFGSVLGTTFQPRLVLPLQRLAMPVWVSQVHDPCFRSLILDP